MAGDLSWNSVQLLLLGNGTDGSTSIVDSSSAARTVTVTGNAQIDTAQSKFGGASILFDGSGDLLTVAHQASLDPLAGDFTLELWVRLASTAASYIIAHKSEVNGNYPWQIWFNTGTGKFAARSYNEFGSGIYDFTGVGPTAAANTWYHLALSRNGNTVRFFVDGVQASSANIGTTSLPSNTGPVCIGAYASALASLNGHVDDFRYTVGVGRYTANFTPPASQAPIGPVSVAGLVLDADGNPAARSIRVYKRSDGALVGSGASNGTTGLYEIFITTLEEVQVICLDDTAGTLENDLIHRVIP